MGQISTTYRLLRRPRLDFLVRKIRKEAVLAKTPENPHPRDIAREIDASMRDLFERRGFASSTILLQTPAFEAAGHVLALSLIGDDSSMPSAEDIDAAMKHLSGTIAKPRRPANPFNGGDSQPEIAAITDACLQLSAENGVLKRALGEVLTVLGAPPSSAVDAAELELAARRLSNRRAKDWMARGRRRMYGLSPIVSGLMKCAILCVVVAVAAAVLFKLGEVTFDWIYSQGTELLQAIGAAKQ